MSPYAEQREELLQSIEQHEEEVRLAVENIADKARVKLRFLEQIRERPVVALVAAVGLGYVVARLVARGRRW